MVRSRLFNYFYIAGFQRYEGAAVFDQLKVGTALSLVPEFDNPYDPDALALYLGQTMIGYVPRDLNETIAQLLYFGHSEIFECRILQVNPENDPWKQVRVGIYVTGSAVV